MSDQHGNEGRVHSTLKPNRRWIYGVFIGCIVVTVLSVWWSTALISDTEADLGVKPEKVQQKIGPREMGMIDQSNIVHDQYGLRLQKSQGKFLAGYGWVDKRHGVARIPIDKAMEAVVEEYKR